MSKRVLAFVLLFSSLLLAKSSILSHAPQQVQARPTSDGALISWVLNLPDTVLSFNNNVPYGIWAPHVNQAMGCVYDLSAFPNATLEQIDFSHYGRQKMHGPYYYRLLFFDMDSSKLFYTIDSLVAKDAFDYPEFEVGVSLGSVPARPHVGIFVEGLSSPDGVISFPALMTDSSDYVPGVSYYLADVNDPFIENDPNYTNFYQLTDVTATATNLIMDLWINTNGTVVKVTPGQNDWSVTSRPQSLSSELFEGILPEEKQNNLNFARSDRILKGFYIYKGDSLNGNFQLVDSVSAEVRSFVDANPPADSSYFYAVASYNTTSISALTPVEYYQPAVLSIAQARKDDDQDFVPDLLNKTVAIRGTVVSPNFSSKFQYFVNDSSGGVQLYAYGFSMDLTVGDSVFVIGKVAQYKGVTEIKVDSAAMVQVLGKAAVDTVELTLAQVGEPYEGQLAVFRNVWLVNPADWPAEGQNGFKVMVTDGQDTVKLAIDKDTDLDGWTPPDGKFNLIALVDQYTSATPANDGYQLRPRFQTDFISTTGINHGPTPVANEFRLLPNYPNPFNPSTTIRYHLPVRSKTVVRVYDLKGSEVATLHRGWQEAGLQQITFNAKNMASGIYFVVVKAGKLKATQKIVLMK